MQLSKQLSERLSTIKTEIEMEGRDAALEAAIDYLAPARVHPKTPAKPTKAAKAKPAKRAKTKPNGKAKPIPKATIARAVIARMTADGATVSRDDILTAAQAERSDIKPQDVSNALVRMKGAVIATDVGMIRAVEQSAAV